MPNQPAGRGPGARDAAPRSAAPRLLAGAIVLALAAVVLGAILGRPDAALTGAGGTGAASARPVHTAGSPAATGEPGAGPTEAATAAPTQDPAGPEQSAEPGSPDPTLAPGAGDTQAERLQRRLDALREKLQIPGVSVAILWDDGRQWLGASGWADVKAGRPMTPDTAFALASVSKTFTAAVVLQLVEEGRLSLDDRVAPLLPQFGLHPEMTVRQLLDHTSGLPDYFLNARIDAPLQVEPDATWTVERTWQYVRKKRPDPGSTWTYSNANYLLLGELVEEVTGRPLAREIRRRFLKPLDLESAWYQAVEEPRADGATGYRIVPRSGGGVRFAAVAPASDVMPFRSVVTAAAGAGSMAATAFDAARWMRAYAAGDVLGAATREAQLADAAETLELGARIPYGLGIQALPVAGHRALGHSGRFLGFRNDVRYLPDDGIAIAVLTNQGSWDPRRIERALLRIVLPDDEPAPSAAPSATPSAAP